MICFSLGNLCFLRRWYDLEHLKERSMDYYRIAPAGPNLLFSTLIGAVLLAAGFWLAWRWVQTHPTPARLKLAHCGFLLVLILPLESVRRYWNAQSNRPDVVSNFSVVVIELLLVAGMVMVLFGNLRILRPARRVTLLLTLLFPSLMLDFAWSGVSAEPASAYAPKPSLPLLPAHAPPVPRVVWLLFDELDQRLAFDARPPSLELPELDRLRRESMVANHVTQTADSTILAIPSLLSGQMFSRADLISADSLRVYPEGSKRGVNWREQPNVFKQARTMGLNATAVGWHHPYCRVLGDNLAGCLNEISGHPTSALLRELSAADEGIANTVIHLFRLQVANVLDMLRFDGFSTSENLRSTYVQRRQQQQYFRIRDRAYAEVANPRIDFLFAHFPAPHLFAIYDRQRRNFTLSSSTGYLDNLALVDLTVGEIRRTLEKAGLWDHTSILITSDHGLRPELWHGRYNWTPELERLTAAGASDTVPFIVKLAGQYHGAGYDRSFSNVVSGDLVLAILGGHVSTPAEVSVWLDEHTAPSIKSVR